MLSTTFSFGTSKQGRAKPQSRKAAKTTLPTTIGHMTAYGHVRCILSTYFARVTLATHLHIPIIDVGINLKARKGEVLRIDSLKENELTTLRVEGKLVGPWVKELEQCWQEAVAQQPSQLVRINLSAVGFIDSQGKQLLCRMRKQGAVLVPTGCFMKSIVDEIEREASKE